MTPPPIAIIGLGKMGANLARQLAKKQLTVFGYNRTTSVTRALEGEGVLGLDSFEELTSKLSAPRRVWLMLPAGPVVDETIAHITPHLEPGDVLIDGGNSFYQDSIRRGQQLTAAGFKFIDVGVSGGPQGALTGACCMVGGDTETFALIEPIVRTISLPNGYQHFAGNGAGHFVKMVHNGIEYGMMQAIAEGFSIMKRSPFDLDLMKVTDIYQHGSVIQSRLVGWLQTGLKQFGPELAAVSSTVAHTGEGAWTVKTAKKLGVPAPIIAGALEFRTQSAANPSYTGQLLSLIRHMFGGHAVH